MISILVPTRGRPNNMVRLWDSIENTVSNPKNVEIIFYIDDDDKQSIELVKKQKPLKCVVKYIIGERIVLSKMWNECHKIAKGPYYHHCGDDVVFRTKNWDKIILEEFSKYPDKIVFIWPRDREKSRGKNGGTHGFLHDNWINTVGYFMPPYFSSDMNDRWLTEVSKKIGRDVFLEDVYVEHMHYAFGKATKDKTHMERLARRRKDRVKKLYDDLTDKREEDCRKLEEFIDGFESK